VYHVTSSVLEPEFSDEKNWLFGSCNARICGRKPSGYRTLLFFYMAYEVAERCILRAAV
jgi:hypothetical protein